MKKKIPKQSLIRSRISGSVRIAIRSLKDMARGMPPTSGFLRRNIWGSYSQQGEDLIVWNFLGKKKRGLYVDIGANDPVRFNNTKFFYDRGWSGINVEPNVRLIERFRKSRPRDTNLNAGIGKQGGTMTFYELDEDAYSTFSRKEAEACVKKGHQIVSQKKVRVMPLSEVFSKHAPSGRIDFLSVDTENYDLVVLSSNDWRRFRPRFVCVEVSAFLEGGSSKAIDRLLTKNGYGRRVSIDFNSIYEDNRAAK